MILTLLLRLHMSGIKNFLKKLKRLADLKFMKV